MHWERIENAILFLVEKRKLRHIIVLWDNPMTLLALFEEVYILPAHRFYLGI